MLQTRFLLSSRRGAMIGIAGSLLVLLSLLLPFGEYTIYNRSHDIGPFIQSLQSELANFMMGDVIQNLGSEGRDGIFFIAAPYLVAGIIFVLSCFALFIPLNRFFRVLYLFLLIVGGLAFSPFLLLVFIGVHGLGFLGVIVGFICMCVGYRNIRKDAANKSNP